MRCAAPDAFFEPVHARIFDKIVNLREQLGTVTAVTLKTYSKSDAALEELGGVGYLARLTAGGQGLLAPRELAEQIAELEQRRRTVASQ